MNYNYWDYKHIKQNETIIEVLAHAFNPSSCKAESGSQWDQGQADPESEIKDYYTDKSYMEKLGETVTETNIAEKQRQS